jgi:hypothetical protein
MSKQVVRLILALALAAQMPARGAQVGPVLGVQGDRFTVDGKPAFLLGCSYYGGLGVADDAAIEADLDDLHRLGFNWIRVWATWDAFDDDVSAVTPQGAVRELYMGRLRHLCALAGQRGMIVDVTVSRGGPPFPPDQPNHRAVMECLARRLKPFRNVYFDLANERNVRDARFVPTEEVAELVTAVKAIDPDRLCTASCSLSPEDTVRFVKESHVDFVTPHLARTAAAPSQTADHTRALLKAMNQAGRVVPVHYQEPFRRGYGNWQPKAQDFKRDLDGAREGGAAGWCLHNGSLRTADQQRPRRCFDMRPSEGRLFDQLDDQERRFLDLLAPEAK